MDVAVQRQATSLTALEPMADVFAPWRAIGEIAALADGPPRPGAILLSPLDSDRDLRDALIADGRTLCAAAIHPRRAAPIRRLAERRNALFSLCVDTRAGMELDLAHGVRAALQRAGLVDGLAADDLETCLHEAVSNALIHGNLGIGSHLRETVEASIRFSMLIEERLNDPDHAARLIFIRAAEIGAALIVSIGDQGAGMPHGVPKQTLEQARTRTVGRGLALMRGLTEDMRHCDGGRVVVLRARRAA